MLFSLCFQLATEASTDFIFEKPIFGIVEKESCLLLLFHFSSFLTELQIFFVVFILSHLLHLSFYTQTVLISETLFLIFFCHLHDAICHIHVSHYRNHNTTFLRFAKIIFLTVYVVRCYHNFFDIYRDQFLFCID